MAKNLKLYKEEYLFNSNSRLHDPRGIRFHSYFDSEFFPGFHSISNGHSDFCVVALIVEGEYQTKNGKNEKFRTHKKGCLSLGGLTGKGSELKVGGKPCKRKCFLLYRTELFQQIFLHYFPEGKGKFIPLAQPDKLERLFDRIKEEFLSSNGFPDEALLAGLFLELMENAARENGRKSEYPEALFRAISAIEEELGSPTLSRQKLAEKTGFSTRTLNRLFSAYLQKGVTEYILERRLKMACGFLQFPFYRIGEIAEKCGFGSAIYMTRVFHKHFHTTPREYRKRQEKILL